MSSIHSRAQDLRSVIGNKIVDPFGTGDVIKFVAYNKYCYAAIKGDNGRWFTTALNGGIPKTMSFNELIEVLRSNDVSSVQVATDYTFVA